MPDAIKQAFEPRERDSAIMEAFGFRLYNQFTVNKGYRRPKELEWIESIRQYKGLYDPDVKIEQNNSRVYPKITRSKLNIVLSRLHEMLFPENEQNFLVEPTPEPSLPPNVIKDVIRSLFVQDPTSGEMKVPSEDEIYVALKKYADGACKKMLSVISDQLIEMNYPEETKKVLRSGLMYGTGVMKGPLFSKRSKRVWKATKDGAYTENDNPEDIPFFTSTRLWDWYPDMSVTDIENMEGSFERHIMTKHDLRKLMQREDFFADAIGEYLTSNPSGDYVPENWEVDLQVIDVEAGTGKTGQISTAVTDDVYRQTNRQTGKKYQVLEYWGYVDGSDLEACGLNVDDPALEYGANIWILGKRIIKAIIFNGAVNKYKVFYYEKDETSLFGEGLPRVMRHSQIAIAAGARMVLDNAACVAGPQVEINWDLLTEGTDYNSFYPRKIWYRHGRGVDAQYPAVRVYNIDCHVDELMKIIDAFKQFGDEETTLPTWMIGQMVNNETAQATSGRMSTITVSIKDIVKNFDTFTEGIIGDLYRWNMEWNPRTDIKGDYNVKARGVSSLVMKEIRMQALVQLSSTMTPDDWLYINRRDFLEEILRGHDIKLSLRTEAEAQQLRNNLENSRLKQLTYAQIESEIEKNRAQALAQATKAKRTNVEAIKDAQTPPEIAETVDPRATEEEIALQQTKRYGEASKIRRSEEKHAQEMAHAADDHVTGKALEKVQTAHDINIKERKAESEIATKEKVATIKAKQKPTKPKSKGGK